MCVCVGFELFIPGDICDEVRESPQVVRRSRECTDKNVVQGMFSNQMRIHIITVARKPYWRTQCRRLKFLDKAI